MVILNERNNFVATIIIRKNMSKTSCIVFSALLAFAGCDTILDTATENDEWYYNDEEDCLCNNSYLNVPGDNSMPKEGEAVIRVSRDYGDVTLSIYEDNLDGRLLMEKTAEGERNVFNLQLNRQYTYAARYVKNGDTIVVPVRSYLECKSQDCQGVECYFIYNNIVDLRLKF